MIDEPRSQTVTGNFRAGEAAVLEAYDERNVDDDASNDGDIRHAYSFLTTENAKQLNPSLPKRLSAFLRSKASMVKVPA